MNATARASLIAAAAIAAACWAVPALLVGAVPPDAGMFAIMALPYALLPITAVALGLLAAGSARTLFWLPAALEAAFALLFPSRSRAARTSRSTASSIPPLDTSPWGCASARPSGVAHHVEPDAHKGPYGSGAFGARIGSSVQLPDLRCTREPFSMRYMVHRCTELFKVLRS